MEFASRSRSFSGGNFRSGFRDPCRESLPRLNKGKAGTSSYPSDRIRVFTTFRAAGSSSATKILAFLIFLTDSFIRTHFPASPRRAGSTSPISSPAFSSFLFPFSQARSPSRSVMTRTAPRPSRIVPFSEWHPPGTWQTPARSSDRRSLLPVHMHAHRHGL